MTPDMRRVYVTEAKREAEGNEYWTAIGWHDDLDSAVVHAKEQFASTKVETRVRQFWVESKGRVTLYGVKPKGEPMPEVPMVEYLCQDHPDAKAKGYEGGTAPRCPECKKAMVVEVMDFSKALDWSGE